VLEPIYAEHNDPQKRREQHRLEPLAPSDSKSKPDAIDNNERD